jgi:hypothetical protein
MAGGSAGNLAEFRRQLMVDIGTLLDEKLANLDEKLSKLATKDDLSKLTHRVASLENENKVLKEQLESMKARDCAVADKLVDLESRSRRNNLIFRGLKGAETTKDCKYLVEKFCSDHLGSDGKVWVNRAHTLGKDRKTVIAHFPEDWSIDYVLQHAKNARDTGVIVHRDFPREIREKRACLSAVRREIVRVAGDRRMPLVFDHLTVEGTRLTWVNGRLRAGQQDGAAKLQELFQHDFTDFLEGVRRTGGRGERVQNTSVSRPNTAPPGPQQRGGTTAPQDGC